MLSLLAASLWTVEALMGLAPLSDPQLRPDGAAWAYVQSGRIHLGDRDLAKGARPRWSPDGKRLAWLNGQIHIEGQPVTTSKLPIASYAWAPDGRALAYLATDDTPAPDPEINRAANRRTRLYWQPLPAGPARLVSGPDHHVLSFALSPDGRRAALTIQRTPRPSDIFHVDLIEVDLASGRETPLVTQPGRDADPAYTPDGRTILFHSQCGTLDYFGERQLAAVPSGGGAVRYITRDLPIDLFRAAPSLSFLPDGRVLLTAGLGTHDELWAVDLASGRGERLADHIAGAASVSADGARLLYLKTNPAHPPELVLREKGAERPLTRAFAHLAALPAVQGETVRWKAADGLAVEGMLWLPFGYQPGRRVPLLVELHGGPTGATLDSFPAGRTYPIPVFLQHGFAVFSPNFRGSANYGATFRQKNALSQGIGDFNDVMTGIDALIARGIADPERLGVMGWSYGGFLTGSTIAQTRRFHAASVGAPAVDWTTYYAQFDGAKEVLWTYFGGTPWEVPENYRRHSYGDKLKNITTPTLLQIGALDYPFTAHIFQALTDLNIPVEHYVYPREGHGFTEPAHQRDLMDRNLAWFKRWLKP